MATTSPEPKRARVEAAPWLLPHVVLQVVHYLADADAANAFLHAVPPGARDESLDALATLFTEGVDFWPKTFLDDVLRTKDPSTVIKALPALRILDICENDARGVSLCRATPPVPTVDVNVIVSSTNLCDLRSILGGWVANITDLDVDSYAQPLNLQGLQRSLAECTRLKTITMSWRNPMFMDQDELDILLVAITESCPRIAVVSLTAPNFTVLEDSECLLELLARPSVTQFRLTGCAVAATATEDLVHGLRSLPSFESVRLECTGRSISMLRPSAPRPSRNLPILDIDASSVVQDTSVWDEAMCLAFPTVLRTFKVYNARMADFPQLPELRNLTLSNVELTSNAVASLCALLATTTTLTTLLFMTPSDFTQNVDAVLAALPRWLSRQRHACNVHLDVPTANAGVVAAIVEKTRSSHGVHLEVFNDINLAASKRVVTALGATSQMSVWLLSRRNMQDDELKALAKMHNVYYEGSYFVSPRPTPTQ
ncbi:hypothetical protein SDRG_08202 [Saprolegnia diclina VS20]|uniref:F-box domain-containing protein n=1 Tax=Saprolegnia diclina (strain VS20) TaxID=1156394 RepID=T0RVF8_SAPDV|nr:hypothetical protein SDRG_08202 [Saprolegnia diclina VS20]EQC34432.1 hypothetical protein SDRG_08202 [Saprolegnia diclina VS20]|eukprot:XP_008612294.1 hypothetical protein SDRG_08202 [Saprolegnia diclina VS20]